MNCEYVTKSNNSCKMKVTKQINESYYCTRHYNILLKNEKEEKEEKKEENYDDNKDNNSFNQINLYEEYLKIIKTPITVIYNFKNLKDIENILNEINITYSSISFQYQEDEIYFYKLLMNDVYYNLKIQNLQIENSKNSIQYEYIVLKELNDERYVVSLCNICKPFYTKKNYYSILITESFYESLEERKENNIITIDDIKEIILQLIIILQYIHINKYLYLDLKPTNIMFINKHSNKVKLTNFTKSNKYINNRSEFLDNVLLNKPTGNILFSSININKSYSGFRIDDLESVLWVLLFILDSKIYIKLNKLNKSNYKPIIKLKEKFIIDKNCEYEFISLFIEELELYFNINNKKPNYSNFINIIKNA